MSKIRHRLLGVDDRPGNLDLLALLVGEYLPEVDFHGETDPHRALRLVETEDFSAAVVDLQMPGLDGIGFCHALRHVPRADGLPVLLVTAHTVDTATRIRGLNAGANDFLSRPIDNAEFMARVRVLLKLREADREIRCLNDRLRGRLGEKESELAGILSRLELVLESAQVGVCEDDPRDGRLVLDARCLELLGPGRPLPLTVAGLRDIVHPDDHAAYDAHFTARDGFVRSVWSVVSGDGRRTWILSTRQACAWDERGVATRSIGIWQDVSELEEARVKAEAANTARLRFLGTISHELRTPMNAVLGFAGILLEEDLTPEHRQHVDTIHQAASGLTRLLNDLVEVAAGGGAAFTLSSAPVCLAGLLRASVDLFSVQAARKGLAIELRREPCALGCTQPDYECRRLRGDGARLSQVLNNLLSNAVRFTEHGRVEVECRPTGIVDGRPWLRLAVHDTGPGIPEALRGRLFQPFAMGDDSDTRRHGGAGLGLAVSRQIVQSMGGRIRHEPRTGGGSSFVVEVPLEVEPGLLLPSAPPAAAGLRILAADDNENNLVLLTYLLGKLGHRVVTTVDGEQAARTFEPGKFDLVLLDIQMPVLDGVDTAGLIRRRDPRVPILALTAHMLPTDDSRFKAAGFTAFLPKPISLDSLRKAIASYCGPAKVAP